LPRELPHRVQADLGRCLKARRDGHVQWQQVRGREQHERRVEQEPRPTHAAHGHHSAPRERNVETRYGTIKTDTSARSTTATAPPLANWFPRKAVKYMEMAGTLVAALSGPAMTKTRSKLFRAIWPRMMTALQRMGFSIGSST